MASSTWGYACCHSTVHISYCTGEAGKHAAAASSAQNLLAGSGAPPEDSTSKPPLEDGGNKGKQRKTDIDVEEEQSKLSEERKRKARANEGDDRFSKKSRDEEAVENKKFDVTEDELGTVFIQVHVSIEKTNEWIQRDIVARGVGWKTRWPTMSIVVIFSTVCNSSILDHVIKMNTIVIVDIAKVSNLSAHLVHAAVYNRNPPLTWSRSAYILQQILHLPCPWYRRSCSQRSLAGCSPISRSYGVSLSHPSRWIRYRRSSPCQRRCYI